VTPGRVGGQVWRVHGAAATAATAATAAAAAAAGGDVDGDELVERVRSYDDDVPGREVDERGRGVGVLARRAGRGDPRRGPGGVRWAVLVDENLSARDRQVLRHGDVVHGGGAVGFGGRNDRFGGSAHDGRRVHGDGAGDCGGRGRVTTAAVGVAGVPALEPGADAAGGVGPGVGVNGDRVAWGRGRRGSRRGRAGRDGAGRGDEQPAAGRRDGHGCSGQRCADT